MDQYYLTLVDVINDPGQNTNLADQHPDLLQQMTTDYQNYSEEVGVVIPKDAKFQLQVSHLVSSMNETQTIDVEENDLTEVRRSTFASLARI